MYKSLLSRETPLQNSLRQNPDEGQYHGPWLPPIAWEVEGHAEEIYRFFGNRVLKSVAVKIKPLVSFQKSEVDMMDFAAEIPGLKTVGSIGHYFIPCTWGTRDRALSATVMPFLKGKPIGQFWHMFTQEVKDGIAEQIREQLAIMRTSSSPYIGRVKRQPFVQSYDRFLDEERGKFVGLFDMEKEWDDWCLDRIRRIHGERMYKKWVKKVEKLRGTDSKRFVLTHGDLDPSNIMVTKTMHGPVIISGIIDWEFSGFFPEYCEYVMCMVGLRRKEKWWCEFMESVLPQCSQVRKEYQDLVMDRGF